MKKIKQRITSIVMAVFTACMMIPTSSGVNAAPEKATSSPAEYRWNFNSNELGQWLLDKIYLGEKVQPYGYGYHNIWNLTTLSDIDTSDNDKKIRLMTGSALQVEPYKLETIDYTTVNNRINNTWTDKLFSARELAVLDLGNEIDMTATFDAESYKHNARQLLIYTEEEIEEYINDHMDEKYYYVGNYGLKLWGTRYAGATADDFKWEGGPWGKTSAPIFMDGCNCTLPMSAYVYNPKHNITGVYNGKYNTHAELISSGYNYMTAQLLGAVTYDCVRPECQISNDRIVIRSDAWGKDSGTPGPDALRKVNKVESHEWKFTILEDGRDFKITDTKVSSDGKTVTVNYSGAKTGDNEYISVIFESDDELYYGNIALSSDDCTATVKLPCKFTRDTKLCIFNEKCNGACMTDFCSNVVELSPTSKIILDANGGDCIVDYIFAEDENHIGELPTPKRAGYIFTGWFADKNSNSTEYTNDSKLDMSQDYTFYAGWLKCPTVSFDACGGIVNPVSVETKESRKLDSLPIPTRDGYKFLGWFTEKDAKGEEVTVNKEYKEDTTIYAGWEDTSPTPSPTPETSANPAVSPSPEKSPEPDVTRDASDISPSNPTKVEVIEKTILNIKDEKDTKGSTFSLLKAKGTPKSKKSIKLSWSKVPGAEEYIIYGNKCGKKNKYKKIATVKGTSYTAKKLKKGTYYKYTIVAVKGDEAIATSKTIHVVTDGGKKGNNTKVKLSKTKLSLTAGKSKKIKATLKCKKKVSIHRKVAWESDNVTVATVKNGKITAVGKGTCYIYAYAQNGVSAKIKVTVK